MSKQVRLYAFGIAAITFLLFGCGPQPPPPAPTLSPQESCVRSGGRFIVHADGSWECTPVGSQPNAPPPTVYVPATAVPPTRVPPSRYFALINHHSQLCLTVSGGTVVQNECSGGNNQLWEVPSDSGSFQIASRSGSCLAVSGIDAVVRPCGASPMWTLRPFGPYGAYIKNPHPHPYPDPKETGTYFLIDLSGKCVDDAMWGHNVNGWVVWSDDCRYSDNSNQLWARYKAISAP